MTVEPPRDFAGYGQHPPHAGWPGGARVAVQFVINVEEGGERSIPDGDGVSEWLLGEEPGAPSAHRNLAVESQYEYGARAGFWRLHRLFTERNVPVTVFGVAEALRRQPEAVAAMNAAGWEICSHGLRWIDHAELSEAEEQRAIARAVALHTELTGSRPLGWYTGRPSERTRRLLVAEGGFRYDSDSFADDLPYWVRVADADHLVVPYTLDNNDARYATGLGYQAESFSAYLRKAFDLLYAEGAVAPKLMSIGLHSRLTGRPGRAAELASFLDHVTGRPDVWLARRIDIARHWHDVHPPDPHH